MNETVREENQTIGAVEIDARIESRIGLGASVLGVNGQIAGNAESRTARRGWTYKEYECLIIRNVE